MARGRYQVVFPSYRVEKEFKKALKKLNRQEQRRIYRALEDLSETPYPPGKKFKLLKGDLVIFRYLARFRMRVGNYRIFYDVDDRVKKVVLLTIRRRAENTYD